jgi:hypothetical protein
MIDNYGSVTKIGGDGVIVIIYYLSKSNKNIIIIKFNQNIIFY